MRAQMKIQNRLLLLSAVVLLSTIAIGCASQGEVDGLAGRVLRLEAVQQNSNTKVEQRISEIDENMNTIDQRLVNLEETTSTLSQSNGEAHQRISEMESALDARTINQILATPPLYIAIAIGILLLGILIGGLGMWVPYFKARRQTQGEATLNEEAAY